MFSMNDLKEHKVKFPEIHNLTVGDVVHYNYTENKVIAGDAQRSSHAIAKAKGWKVRTKRIVRGGVEYMVIGRVK